MALFSKTNTDASKTGVVSRNHSSVLLKPHITEKAVSMGERNVYTFQIRPSATKRDVTEAVAAIYNVTPVKIRIVNREPRQYKSRRLNRVTTAPGVKKVYVYLKKGETINLV